MCVCGVKVRFQVAESVAPSNQSCSPLASPEHVMFSLDREEGVGGSSEGRREQVLVVITRQVGIHGR